MLLPRGLFRFLGVVAFLAGATVLESQINRGIIEGLVTDQQGAVVPGVEVAITSIETNVTATTTTNSAGYYRVGDLVPGKYRAQFAAN